MPMFRSEDGQLLDIYALARCGDAIECQFETHQLKRCQELFGQGDERLLVKVKACQAESRVVIAMGIEGSISLVCQRCLQPYQYKLDISRKYVEVESAFEAVEGVFSELDPVEKVDKSRISLIALVEDEILLSIPTIPRHSNGHCQLNVAESAEYCY